MDSPRVTRSIGEKIHPKQCISSHGFERQAPVLVLSPQRGGIFAASLLRRNGLEEREVRFAARAVIPKDGEEADDPVERPRGAVESRMWYPPPVVVQSVLLAGFVSNELRHTHFVGGWGKDCSGKSS